MHKPRTQDWLALVALSLMWGTSFLFTKIAVTTLAAPTVVASRLLLGALALLAVGRARRLTVPRSPRLWLHFAILSLFGNTLPFLSITWGQRAIDSGLASLLLAIMPLATLVLAHFFVEGERMTRPKIIGFVIGLVGVAILVGPQHLTEIGGDGGQLLGQAAVTLGALLYAINAVLARGLPPGDPFVHTAATVSLATLTMAPIGFAPGEAAFESAGPRELFALLWLGGISTAAATILYFRIIAEVGPTFLALINYLIPPIAIVSGALVLGERPSATSLIALAVILAGIALSQWGSTEPPPTD